VYREGDGESVGKEGQGQKMNHNKEKEEHMKD
jgi:hypothetical protein